VSDLDRVLLLDDDASVRRFVSMALEELPIRLVECETVAQAIAALREAPVKLLITDLMLRNESGFDLLDAIERDPPLLGDGRVAVFSAGLGTAVLKRLAGHRVWRLLSKPTPVATLERCVLEAISGVPDDTAQPAPALAAGEDAAVQSHFGGDQALFLRYRASCLAQFPLDLSHAATAVAQRDAAGLRRIGHNLKSVLRMIGHAELAAEAEALDQAAAGTDWAATQIAHGRLAAGMARLLDNGR
jgi:CheY-like chemotaxis protein